MIIKFVVFKTLSSNRVRDEFSPFSSLIDDFNSMESPKTQLKL